MSKEKPFPGRAHNFDFLPSFHFAYVHSAEEFRIITDWAGVAPFDFPQPGNGLCATFDAHLSGGAFCLVAINSPPNATAIQNMGMLAHECSHALDYLWKYIGEREAGAEIRAYALQFVFQQLATDMAACHAADKELPCDSP